MTATLLSLALAAVLLFLGRAAIRKARTADSKLSALEHPAMFEKPKYEMVDTTADDTNVQAREQ